MRRRVAGTAPRMTPRPAPAIDARQVAFGDLLITCDDNVLQPRSWTAAQSEWAADLSGGLPPGRLLELCTGAGHIGLQALHGTARTGVLVDNDPVACALATANAAAAGLADRVEVRERMVDDCVGLDEEFVLVIADPPWVPAGDVGRFPEDPRAAIDGGVDGLDLARRCLTTIDRCLHDDGAAVLQLGSIAQADDLGDWAAGRVDLVASEVRSFGRRGVLVLLRRPQAGDGR